MWKRSKQLLIAISIIFVKIYIKHDKYKIGSKKKKKKIIPKSSKLHTGIQESRIRNDRQTVFQLVRDLVQAQFDRADEELTKRLWQDVADREIDLDRVINLMYTCSFHEDDYEMTKVDETFQKRGVVGWINYYPTAYCLGPDLDWFMSIFF